MDYVSERACLYELSRTLRAWERKVDISEVSWDYINGIKMLHIMLSIYNRGD